MQQAEALLLAEMEGCERQERVVSKLGAVWIAERLTEALGDTKRVLLGNGSHKGLISIGIHETRLISQLVLLQGCLSLLPAKL